MILCYVYGLTFQTIREIRMEDLVKNKLSQLCININLCNEEIEEHQQQEVTSIESKLIIDQDDYMKLFSKYFDTIYEDTGQKSGYFLRTVHGYKFTEKRMGLNAMFAVGVDVARFLQLGKGSRMCMGWFYLTPRYFPYLKKHTFKNSIQFAQ